MYGKRLAYTVKIEDVKPIEGADKIELAQVMIIQSLSRRMNSNPAISLCISKLILFFRMG